MTTDGKFLSLEGRPFRVRGATYGTFAPRADGALFPERARVAADFAAMARAGLNTVRTYTAPPRDVLEEAEEHGLRLLVGVHYRDWRYEARADRAARRRVMEAGRRAVAEAMETLSGRASVLAVSVGNEVPGDVVRLHGIGAVEDTLSRLAADVHDADPAALVTYTSFPTTEYLQVEGQDLSTFNVFLERPDDLRRYLRHLQVVSEDRPLVLTEVGLASEVHGDEAQAESLSWQLRTVDEVGCAGAIVFSWTDEWDVDGQPVDGWGFGLTDEERRPRPALEVVRRWAGRSVRDLREAWPRVSVVVCAHNGDRLLDACLRSLTVCDYPDLEVLVCDDGSTDGTAAVAARYPFQTLMLERGGLSAARNAGLEASTGEIVAYLDADAQCHPEWPFHLVLSLDDERTAAAGGPNLPVEGVGLVERAVAASPGGPVEVLVADDRAEHVPGCNMAFRRDALEEIGGFDSSYTAAGDDVDVCWKLLDRGYEIAFSPAAQVRHHRRDTIRGYLRQQRGYGRAERLLVGAHAHRFNGLGQARWHGVIYGGVRVFRSLLRPVVYHGPAGGAPFQPVVGARSDAVTAWVGAYLPLLALLLPLGALAPLSAWWLAAPALALLAVAGYAAATAVAVRPAGDECRPYAFRALVGLLHVLQPIVRTWGRLTGKPVSQRFEPVPEWTGDRVAWLQQIDRGLRRSRCRVRWGSATDAWDLEASVGPFLRARAVTAVLWSWTAAARVDYGPRRGVGWGIAAVGGLLLAGPVWAAVGAAAVLGAAAFELVLLRRAVKVAVAAAHATRPEGRERAVVGRLERADGVEAFYE